MSSNEASAIGRRGVMVTGHEKLAVAVEVVAERRIFGRHEYQVWGLVVPHLLHKAFEVYRTAWVDARRVEVERS